MTEKHEKYHVGTALLIVVFVSSEKDQKGRTGEFIF